MGRILILAMLGLMVGCSHPHKVVRIDVPSLATLRSFIPEDLRTTLPAVDPKKDGRVAFQVAYDLLPKGNVPIPTVDEVRKNPAKFEAELKPFDRGLEAIVRASRLRDWSTMPDDSSASIPIPKMPVDMPMPPFPNYAKTKNAAKKLVVRARTDMVLGYQKAADEYLATVRLADSLCQGRQTFIGFLVGIAVDAIGNRAIQTDAGQMSEPMLKAILTGLPDETRLPIGAAETFRTEFYSDLAMLQWSLNLILNPKTKDSDPMLVALRDHPDPFDAADTVAIKAKIFRAEIQTTLNPDGPGPKPGAVAAELFKGLPETPATSAAENAKWPDPGKLKEELKALHNPLGLFLDSPTFATSDMPMMLRRHEVDGAATRLILALNLYRIRHRHVPAKLEDLVTDRVLPRVPIDQFDGKPLRYDPKRGIVWSVGKDARDDGGHEKPFVIGGLAKDFVWSIDGHTDAR